jgi:DNA-binding NarL/FixJ family response regulator
MGLYITKTIIKNKNMNKRKSPIENKIYAALIGHCEEMESKDVYRGNGHHLAQRLASMVSVGLLPKEQRKIYDVLTVEPQTTKEISEKVKKPTKTVSAHLKQIYDSTMLVHFKNKNTRRKLWFK